MFETSRHSRSLLKIIQKYLQACQTSLASSSQPSGHLPTSANFTSKQELDPNSSNLSLEKNYPIESTALMYPFFLPNMLYMKSNPDCKYTTLFLSLRFYVKSNTLCNVSFFKREFILVTLLLMLFIRSWKLFILPKVWSGQTSWRVPQNWSEKL